MSDTSGEEGIISFKTDYPEVGKFIRHIQLIFATSVIEEALIATGSTRQTRCSAPSCGGKMRIISFIENPKVIDKIILHLNFTFEAERPPPLQVAQQELLTTAEERGEYF